MFGRLIFTIAGLVVIGLGGAYFASAPFRTNANLQLKQWTEWTPENIARDPRGYLAWLAGELRGAEKQLIALQVSTNQRLVGLRRDEATLSRRIDDNVKLINELQIAAAKADWPAKVRMRDLSQKEVEQSLVKRKERLEAAQKRLAQIRAQQAKALATLASTEQLKLQLKDEEMSIANATEEFGLRGSTDFYAELSGLRDYMNALQDQSSGIVALLGQISPNDAQSTLATNDHLSE